MTRPVLPLIALALVACTETPATPDASVAIDATVPRDAAPIDAGNDASDARAPLDATPDTPPDIPDRVGPLHDALCAPLARIRCAVPHDCACPDPERPDDEACVADETAACMDTIRGSTLGEAIQTTAVRVDEAALAACIARLEHAFDACAGHHLDFVAGCAGAFVDRAALDETCTIRSGVCAEGAGTCAQGTCSALPPRDATCVEPFPVCAGELVCRADQCLPSSEPGGPCTRAEHCPLDHVCSDGTCRASLAPIGGACVASSDCVANARCVDGTCAAADPTAACTTDDDCASLGRCKVRFAPRCSPRLAAGDPCFATGQCAADTYCHFDDRGAGTCVPRPGPGFACEGYCMPGLACGPGGTCAALGAAGDPCRADWPDAGDGCEDGLACVTGICRTPPSLGEPCADDLECAAGAACAILFEGPRCVTPRGEGEACTTDDCRADLFCDAGACRPRRLAGAECTGIDCAEGLDCIEDAASGSWRCAPIPSLDMPCAIACADDSVCRDVAIGGACRPIACDELPEIVGDAEPF